MKRGALRGGVFGLAAAALAITACSSSSSTGSASPAAASGSGSAGSSTAHGTPINLAFLTEFSTAGSSGDGWAGIQAAIRYVNAQGGIKGRPLAATECVDNQDDPRCEAIPEPPEQVLPPHTALLRLRRRRDG